MRYYIWGVPIDFVSAAQAYESVMEIRRRGGFRVVTTPNPEILYRARSDRELRRVLSAADLAVPDGVGVVLGLRLLYGIKAERVPGVDLMTALLRGPNDLRFYLLGATAEVVAAAADNARHLGANVVGYHHGYFPLDDDEVIQSIKQARPDVLLVGMGSPRQEFWIERAGSRLTDVVAITVGGSFDVLSGKVARAPDWCRRLGLEWCYRIVSDPSRWRRALVLPKFALGIVWERLTGNNANGRKGAGAN